MTYSRTTILENLRIASRVLLSVALMAGLLLFPACSSVPRELEIQTVQTVIKRPPLRPAVPNPQPVQQTNVKWKILKADRLPAGKDWVYFGVTPQDYERLSRNKADVLRFIKESMFRFRYYRGEAQSVPGLRGTVD